MQNAVIAKGLEKQRVFWTCPVLNKNWLH